MDYDDPYLRELLSRLDNSSVARQVKNAAIMAITRNTNAKRNMS